MNLKSTFLLLFSMLSMSLMAQTQITDADLTNAYSMKVYNQRVVCHDPSIFIDDITNPTMPKYYIYGSHLGRGLTYSSSNYQSWSVFKAGEENTGTSNSLFANTSGTLVNYANAYNTHAITKVKNCNGEEVQFGNFNAHDWQYTGFTVKGNQWAPDVIYNKTMKKWCMYMSINGDKWCSVIVCLTSNSPEGPWIYQGPVVFSGFGNNFAHVGFTGTDDWKKTDYAIATGETSLPSRYKPSDNYGNTWPNCIDPCVFYDDDDNLWMSYGSWSGGIFILKLNPENGLRDYQTKYSLVGSGSGITSDPYFGKKIAGGYYCSGEASYIQKIGNYYYLWMTNGGLEAAGGYQMRVYRSATPDGEYLDTWGLNAKPGKYVLNFGSNAGRDYGLKLFGNYKWDLMPDGEVAQGHNSATIDKQGRALLVNHTRFQNGGEGHQVRVHQLFQTQDEWIVAAPYEFSGETVTDNDIKTKAMFTTEQICGDYQLMIHPFRQDTKNKVVAVPVNITLNADGTISGAYTGTWSCPAGTSYIDIKLNKVLGSSYTATFHGVIIEQTIDYSNIKAICFTACGTKKSETQQVANGQSVTTSGLCIWGSKADYKAAIKYTKDNLQVPMSSGATVNAALPLPTAGKLGTNVSWKSSDTSVMTDDGKVAGKGNVTMTLSIEKDGYVYKKDYNINVDAEADPTPTIATYYPVSSIKNTTSAWWQNFSTENYILKNGDELHFKFYNYSRAVNNYDNWCLYGANATHGAAGFTEYFGIRNDNWNNTIKGNTGCTSNFNWDTFRSDMNGSLVDMKVTYVNGTFNMSSTITTTANKTYTYSYTSYIQGAPSQMTLFFVNEGSYIDGSSFDTAIRNIEAGDVKREGRAYNLSGQPVNARFKGIVIKNGRKYIQK